jgi:large subunit ribosomal protein L16
MLLAPKNSKYTKVHKGRLKGIAAKATKLAFGFYGIKVLEPFWLTQKQIEAARKIIAKSVKKIGTFWIRVFPDKPRTKHPHASRMGSGRGALKDWVAPVLPGAIIFEISEIPEDKAKSVFEKIKYKLPVKINFITS